MTSTWLTLILLSSGNCLPVNYRYQNTISHQRHNRTTFPQDSVNFFVSFYTHTKPLNFSYNYNPTKFQSVISYKVALIILTDHAVISRNVQRFQGFKNNSKIYLPKLEILQLVKVCLNINQQNKKNSIKFKHCSTNVKKRRHGCLNK